MMANEKTIHVNTSRQTQMAPFCGRVTFALDNALRRVRAYLQKAKLYEQIKHLPDSYPQRAGQLDGVDIVVRAKILRAHLADAFAKNSFSVRSVRSKNPTIYVVHDSEQHKEIAEIVQMYADSNVGCKLSRIDA